MVVYLNKTSLSKAKNMKEGVGGYFMFSHHLSNAWLDRKKLHPCISFYPINISIWLKLMKNGEKMEEIF